MGLAALLTTAMSRRRAGGSLPSRQAYEAEAGSSRDELVGGRPVGEGQRAWVRRSAVRAGTPGPRAVEAGWR